MTDRKHNPPTDAGFTGRTTSGLRADGLDIPWVISRALNAEGDLHDELAQLYPNQPLMSLFYTRAVGGRLPRQLAILNSQDGACSMSFEIDPQTRAAQCAYTLSSMLTLRFDLSGLSDMDRTQWLEQMRLGGERPHILWGKMRWRSDYMIWSRKRYFFNLYAFSTHHTEAAARLSPEVGQKLLAWLNQQWGGQTEPQTGSW